MKFAFTDLTDDEVNKLAEGLSYLPWRAANDLLVKLQTQVKQQQSPVKEPEDGSL